MSTNTGFNTILNSTIPNTDLGTLYCNVYTNQTINGAKVFNTPLSFNIYTINNSSHIVNTNYVNNTLVPTTNNSLMFKIEKIPTNQKQSIIYPTTVTLNKSNISVSTNTRVVYDQIMTFGAGGKETFPGLWVAIGIGTSYTIAYSYDSINWVGVPGSISIFNPVFNLNWPMFGNVLWNGIIWVAVSSGNFAIAYSLNGVNWTGVPNSSAFFGKYNSANTSASALAWNGYMWLAGGYYNTSNNNNNMCYSYDGINWFALGQIGKNDGIISLGWNGVLWVATGSSSYSSNLLYSNDGFTWYNTNVTTSTFFEPVWNGNMWLITSNNSTSVFNSMDGIYWYISLGLGVTGSSNPKYGMSWNGYVFVSGTSITASNAPNYSYDGYNWATGNLAGSLTAFYPGIVRWNGSIWVASSYYSASAPSHSFAYSSDGINWLGTCAFNSIFTGGIGGLAWGNKKEHTIYIPANRTLLLGNGPNGSIAYSYTGNVYSTSQNETFIDILSSTNWILGNTNTSGLSNTLLNQTNSAAWDGTKWVAVGSNSTVYTNSALNFSNNGTAATASVFFTTRYNNGTTSSNSSFVSGFSTGWSIEAWVQIPVSGGNGSGGICGCKDIAFLFLSSNCLKIQNANVADTTALNDGKWHYVAATWSNSLSSGYYYIDGVQKTAYTLSNANPSNVNQPFTIGTLDNGNTAGTYNFVGYISEVRFWRNVILSAATIALQWNTPVPTNSTGLIGYFSPAFFNSNNSYSQSTVITNNTVLMNFAGGNQPLYYNNNSSNGNTLNVAYFGNYINNNMFTGNTIAYSSIVNKYSLNYNTVGSFGNAGNSWVGLGNNLFSISGTGIACNGSLWVATGSGGNTLAYSTDGFTWVGLGKQIFTTSGLSVTYNGTIWVATGSGGNQLAYSANGTTWYGTNSTIFSVQCNQSAWNGIYWYAVGQGTGNTIAVSNDGITWTGQGNSIFSYSGTGIACNTKNNMTIAVGSPGVNVYAAGSNSIAISAFGNAWLGLGCGMFNYGSAVSWNGNYWISAGYGGNSLAYSTDGISWFTNTKNTLSIINSIQPNYCISSTIFNTNYNLINYNIQPVWAAVGKSTTMGIILYSSDGLNWNNSNANVFSAYGSSIAYNGSIWIAVGSGVTNTIAYSYSLNLSWVGIGNSIFSTSGYGIAWNGTIWVATGTGTNTIAYSYDGINWNGLGLNIFTNYGNCVVYNNNLNGFWVATGSGTNTLAYSFNGIVWTGLGTQIFSLFCNCVNYNSVMWLAGGSGTNALAYSYNGINWIGQGTSFGMTIVNSISWNGRVWFIVGAGTYQFMFSYNGFIWYPSFNTFGDALTQPNTCCWNGKLFIIGGSSSTTNPLFYSYNGNIIAKTSYSGTYGNTIIGLCNNNLFGGYTQIGKYNTETTLTLDVVNDNYYQAGCTNFVINVNT